MSDIQTDAMAIEHEQLLNALEVILTAKNTRDCLALHDSRALEQAVKAVEANLSDWGYRSLARAYEPTVNNGVSASLIF